MASTSALKRKSPGTTLHPDRNTHVQTTSASIGIGTGMQRTHFTHAGPMLTKIHMCIPCYKTLAAGMAMCTNTPTVTHPLNLRRQKPRVTTSLSAVKPRNYDKPPSVFVLPFLTVHYRHHLPCSHLPSNLE